MRISFGKIQSRFVRISVHTEITFFSCLRGLIQVSISCQYLLLGMRNQVYMVTILNLCISQLHRQTDRNNKVMGDITSLRNIGVFTRTNDVYFYVASRVLILEIIYYVTKMSVQHFKNYKINNSQNKEHISSRNNSISILLTRENSFLLRLPLFSFFIEMFQKIERRFLKDL